MCRKVDELKSTLTTDERGAIAELGRPAKDDAIPFPTVERLINLGLAELNFGGLDLTVAGRQVLDSMRRH